MYLNALEIRRDLLRCFDPRARVIASVLCIAAAVHVSNLVILAAIAACCLLLLCRDFVCIIKRLIPLEVFCVLFLIQSIFGLLDIHAAFVYILRVHCAALMYMLGIVPMGLGALAHALAALRVNGKLISILYLTHRYIYLLQDTVFCSIQAMRLRQNPRALGGLFVWKSYAAVFATALARAFSRADTVSAALCLRGFDGTIPQSGKRGRQPEARSGKRPRK